MKRHGSGEGLCSNNLRKGVGMAYNICAVLKGTHRVTGRLSAEVKSFRKRWWGSDVGRSRPDVQILQSFFIGRGQRGRLGHHL